MANAEELARELHGLMHHTAKRVDEQPTGVVPGYSSTLGGTVLPNGKVRYIGTASKGIAVYRLIPGDSYSPGGGGTRIDFHTSESDDDAVVTIGASWVYTCPVDGIYHYDVMINFAYDAGLTAGDEFFLQGVFNGTSIDIAYYVAQVTGNYPPPPLLASGARLLSAGNTIYFNVYHNATNNQEGNLGRVCIFKL